MRPSTECWLDCAVPGPSPRGTALQAAVTGHLLGFQKRRLLWLPVLGTPSAGRWERGGRSCSPRALATRGFDSLCKSSASGVELLIPPERNFPLGLPRAMSRPGGWSAARRCPASHPATEEGGTRDSGGASASSMFWPEAGQPCRPLTQTPPRGAQHDPPARVKHRVLPLLGKGRVCPVQPPSVGGFPLQF